MQDGNIYIGSTSDLRRRLNEHTTGKVFATKTRRPVVLCYYEAYADEHDARKREHALKNNGCSLFQLKRRIQNSLQHDH